MTILDEIQANIHSVSITLPTRGIWYDGNLLDGVDPMEVSVSPISFVEEVSFRDPVMVLTGKTVVKTIRRSIPGIRDPFKLCDVDVRALLLGIRIASHGSDMKIKYRCLTKDKEYDMTLDLFQLLGNFVPFTEDFISGLRFDLPEIGQEVSIRPMLYEDMVRIAMYMAKEKFGDFNPEDILGGDDLERYTDAVESVVNTSVEAIVSCVHEVVARSGVSETNRDIIREWFVRLPTGMAREVVRRVESMNEKIAEYGKVSILCPECGENHDVHVEMDPTSLFTVAENA